MEELLQFPEQYRVSATISRERFLREAILVSKHRDILQDALEYLRLLYTLPYRDGEVVILLAEINDTRQEGHFLAELTNAIQCAIPYPMLLIIKCEYVVKFYVHDEEENAVDRTEKTPRHPTCTKDIVLNALKVGDQRFLSRLRAELEEAHSATNLCERWTGIIKNYTEIEEAVDHERKFFRESLEQSRELLRRETCMAYTLERGRRFFFHETDEMRLYPGRALDEHGDWEHRLFLDYCCGHARSLYRQTESPVASVEQWLKCYLAACSSYAQSLYCRTLSNRAAREIVAAFYAEEEAAPDDDVVDLFSELDLMECMGAPYYTSVLYSAPPKPEAIPSQTEDKS